MFHLSKYFQGSVMLQNEGADTVLSNGLTSSWSTEGVVSYDFSGQVTNNNKLTNPNSTTIIEFETNSKSKVNNPISRFETRRRYIEF